MKLTAGEIDLIITRAFHKNMSAVRFNESFGKRQSESRAAALETSLAGGVFAQIAGLIELAEYDLAEIRVNAHAGITDHDLNRAVRQVGDAGDVPSIDRDPAAVGCEFNGIGDQMME